MRRDLSIRVPIALIGMACRKAPACCADTADRRATAAWFGAVFSSNDKVESTRGKSHFYVADRKVVWQKSFSSTAHMQQ